MAQASHAQILDFLIVCTYNVRIMTTINTTLTTSGNSVAVRLPKELLKMSGLGNKVQLEAKNGKIIISKHDNQRQGWDIKIASLISKTGDPAKEFSDMDVAANDDLESLTWDGISYEEWLKGHDKLS